ncbi:MAG: 16S rRNA (guanine(527)-N(7))-methyltransferase RsmG [Clostridiales bacterium]|jgi:16S rRNA (guanine527-N7)-methyltransferase|nr:16S rRNA (guanine(527)-N(7))-methyltransferase RsmG [Clostridiales bacterium]
MTPPRLDLINRWLTRNGYASLTEEQSEKLTAFQRRVLSVNEYMNLTAITDGEGFAVKHFIDSLTVLPWIKQNARVADVGTGAGFPGVPVKIMRRDLQLTLMDSLRKRIFFLREAAALLGLEGVTCVHARAEELSRQAGYREAFDVCAARAVARLDKLAGYTLPLLKKGGLLLAMKGPEAEAEIAAAKPALQRYGGAVAEVWKGEIAEGMTHTVIVVEKS